MLVLLDPRKSRHEFLKAFLGGVFCDLVEGGIGEVSTAAEKYLGARAGTRTWIVTGDEYLVLVLCNVQTEP